MHQNLVYCIWHIRKPNLFYIGSTTCKFNIRINAHIRELRNNQHFNPHLQNVINKYGLNGVKYKIIEIFPNNISYSSLGLLEDCYIQAYKNKYGKVYNVYLDRSKTTLGSKRGRINISNFMKNNNPMFSKDIVNRAMKTKKQLYPASKIRQYSLEGNLIKIWNNTLEISNSLKIDESNISRACRFNKLCKGYIFFYDSDFSEDMLIDKIKDLKNRIYHDNGKRFHYNSIIYQLDPINGNKLYEYKSATEAGIKLNLDPSNINRAANGVTKKSGGYIWIYKADFSKELVDEKIISLQTRLPTSQLTREKKSKNASQSIHQIDPIKGNIINTYKSARNASQVLNIDESNISRAASGSNKSSGGFIWIYEKDYSEELKTKKIDRFYKRKN